MSLSSEFSSCVTGIRAVGCVTTFILLTQKSDQPLPEQTAWKKSLISRWICDKWSITYNVVPTVSLQLLGKLIGRQLDKTCLSFCGSRRLINLFSRARHSSLLSANLSVSLLSVLFFFKMPSKIMEWLSFCMRIWIIVWASIPLCVREDCKGCNAC